MCIGEYSALSLAKLLSLVITQAGLLSALAESQFCYGRLIWVCLLSFAVYLNMCKFRTCDALIQKYGKIVFLQMMISNVAFFTTIELVVMCKKVLAM